MSVTKLCQDFMLKSLTIHKKRVLALADICQALMNGAYLSVTSLGRYVNSNAQMKNNIKKVDRLLSNEQLYQEQVQIYQEIFAPLLACLSTLYIIVDWSGCCRSDEYVLRASLQYDGRSITIYNENHPQHLLGNEQVHIAFLENLSKILPSNKPVIMVTDAGFLTPWFKAVTARGWDYVGRINNLLKIRLDNADEWIRVNTFEESARQTPTYVGTGQRGKSVSLSLQTSFYTYKQPPAHRHGRSKFPAINKRYSNSNSRAWLIMTSLPPETFKAKQIINIYKKRMQIEQNFRDDKSERFGFGWRFGRTLQIHRLAILLLIASISTFFLWWMGLSLEDRGLHLKYQANTTKNKRVLSFVFLAKEFLRHLKYPISMSMLHDAAKRFENKYEEFILCQ